MRKCLTVINIMEKAIRMTDDTDVKRAAGQVIKRNELEAKKKLVGELFLKYGLVSEIVEESQKLDKMIAMEQRIRLEAC